MSRELKHASHLPVLKAIYSFMPFKNVLEFGCGNYSTKFFAEVCERLISIENKDINWYNKIKNEIKEAEFIFKHGIEAIQIFERDAVIYDLIFIDGINRQECNNASFGRSPIIVVHDLSPRGAEAYLKDVVKNKNYELVLMNGEYPATGIFTSNKELIKQLSTIKGFIKYNW